MRETKDTCVSVPKNKNRISLNVYAVLEYIRVCANTSSNLAKVIRKYSFYNVVMFVDKNSLLNFFALLCMLNLNTSQMCHQQTFKIEITSLSAVAYQYLILTITLRLRKPGP